MRKRKWTEQQLKEAAEKLTSIRQIIKCLDLIPAGGNYAQVKKYLEQYGISTKNLKGKGWRRGLKFEGEFTIPLEKILVVNSTYQSHKLKNRLYLAGLKSKKCEKCGWAKTSTDGRLPLELDHINGDSKDNRLENLRILCPNCHSLQPTHRGSNRKKRKN
ncbi:MAG: HNH endonuclease signature motif containing protein [Patescibacteria group bacterium]|nr:HNH endonuclease [Patescibacteria group bacterium]MBU2508894.1 HNH endonuclease [Patescibacteria group bacterium]